MKDGFRHIVGRRIAAVVVAANERASPRKQVFLVFEDGTRFELWGDAFSCCSGLDSAAGIERYVESAGGSVVRVFGEAAEAEASGARAPSTCTPAPACPVTAGHDLEPLLQRDLDAWQAAKAAIARAARRPA